ncbi:hypothetical protein B0A49_07906 [Cryomyces minteri]|uniref:NAD-dependent epimerase/dehydratase domain-containing protein n=2 Tax=Cryomyces minteri TaxID=331657 RepID=A0A4V5NDY1_9PEZI|nr:hypothetical protein B0A49_07906 [Cryomyces minteri]
MSESTSEDKPAVLIIGGLGYVGRFLALHIHSHSLASTLRLVDKQLPELAWLAPEFKDACSRANFVQADASQERSLPRIFDLPDGRQFDYVFNCGGETRYSQDDEVYKLRSYNLSMALGKEAAKRKTKSFVEVSTGMVYAPNSVPRKETDKTKPWLKQAKWKLQAEEDLARIPGLNLVVLRLAHVYGPYAGRWLGTQLALARVYQSMEREMKWLWGENLRTNTVHVSDAARALWTAASWRARTTTTPKPGTPPPLFNVVDHGNTSQGTMAGLIRDIFGIATGFQGTLINTFARLNLEHVVDDVNDETLDPWAELQQKAGIGDTTPLSPFMEKELLKDTDLSLDGRRFEEATGFR